MAQTDNSCLNQKVVLRDIYTRDTKKPAILSCYGGANVVWENVSIKQSRELTVTRIDVKKYGANSIKGDNLKVIKSLDLSRFTHIDLDAYGVPFDQLEYLFKQKYSGTIFITFIQSVHGNLPAKLLKAYGYTDEMLKKAMAIFTRNGKRKLDFYLAVNGVKEYNYFDVGRKVYLAFKI
jgi:hypothetical protein